MPNLVIFGAGLWMIGDGIPGILSASGILKVIAGAILIAASFGIGE